MISIIYGVTYFPDRLLAMACHSSAYDIDYERFLHMETTFRILFQDIRSDL